MGGTASPATTASPDPPPFSLSSILIFFRTKSVPVVFFYFSMRGFVGSFLFLFTWSKAFLFSFIFASGKGSYGPSLIRPYLLGSCR